MGSSPQVRGTSVRQDARRDVGGLIPAGAGNIASTERSPAIHDLGAHPRRCGEHRPSPTGPDTMTVDGLIPAGAGNICQHPPSASGLPRSGSSPQVRGTCHTSTGPSMMVLQWAHPRRCGEHVRLAGSSMVGLRRAHPRRCGEHRRAAVRAGLGRSGSSPQVRGTFASGAL